MKQKDNAVSTKKKYPFSHTVSSQNIAQLKYLLYLRYMTAEEIERENTAIANEYRNLLKISYITLSDEDKKLIR